MNDNKIKGIAINLPQFHPIPENDLWWGKGFTEWTNVTKAKPLFKGHYQPHLPADLGFYDMRLEDTLIQQAEMAKAFGIHGFCYYHYWFNGKRLLNAPLDRIIKSKTPDFPFMLCWANENWTRRWDGKDQEILIKQDHSEKDDLEHIQFLINNFFSDPRYIQVDGKPFFLIYRPSLFPDIKKTTDCWRKEAKKNGFPDLYLGYMQNFGFKAKPEEIGFDCAVEFQPDFSMLPVPEMPSFQEKLLNKLKISSSVHYSNLLLSYEKFVSKIIQHDVSREKVYKSVCPMWDNTARRPAGATIFKDPSPVVYEKWLRHACNLTIQNRNPENFLFLNAWNEWAEGNHLEPCQKFGKLYLEATQRVLQEYA
jgi:lipopolysaccharide biosynthesis protein